MMLRRKLNGTISWPVCVVVLATAAVVLPLSSRLVADEESPLDGLPKSGVFEVVITANGEPITTKSITRALSKLQAISKAEARRPDSTVPILVAIDVNETTREFTDVTDAIRALNGISEILNAAKKAKIQLGELGRLDVVLTQSEQSQTPDSESTGKQQYRPPNARDGDDGFGIGGGLGGQGGGGIASQRQARDPAGLQGGSAGTREVQIQMLRLRLTQLLATPEQSDPLPSSVARKIATKKYKLGKATLFSRMVHRDYQKATFSFEFGLRDDPAYLHDNDWDLQYGNGGEHFHVTMVSDDRSRLVDLGKMDWEQLDERRLAKLPPYPQPRREFVPTALGHIYLVHTVDRNSDLYALFRVEAVNQQAGTCDIAWRLVDASE